MIYLSTNTASTISYHLERIKKNSSKNNDFSIIRYTGIKAERLPVILKEGSYFNRVKNIISLDDKIKKKEIEQLTNLKQNKFSTSYISIEDKEMYKNMKNTLKKLTEVEEISISEAEISSLFAKSSVLFTTEGYNYIKNKFIHCPTKFELEKLRLLIIYNQRRERIDLDCLLELYDDIKINHDNRRIIYNLGTNYVNHLIYNCSESDLYALFIGGSKRPSLLYNIFIKYKSKLEFNEYERNLIYGCSLYLRDAVLNKTINIKVAVILFNQWINRWVYPLKNNEFKLTINAIDDLLTSLGH
jgi:hypothetical protein